jgi:putative ABC transport system permease protein
VTKRSPWFDVALLCYPAAFRARFGGAMRVAFREQVSTRRRERGALSALGLAARSILSTAIHGLGERRAAWRSRPARSRTPLMRHLAQDVQFTFRMMRRQPAVTALCIASLAIGIGASAAAFSLVDASLIRALPLPAPDRLVVVEETFQGSPSQVSHENLRDWERMVKSFDGLSAFRGQTVNVTGLDTPGRIRGGFVSSAFFSVAGVPPAIGRPLVPADEEPSAPPAVVINHWLWRGLFGGAPDILERTVSLNNVAFRIVGVMPASFVFPMDGADAWIPVRFYPGTLTRGSRQFVGVARLAPQASLGAAQSELDGVMAALVREHPGPNRDRGARVTSMHTWLSSGGRDQLSMVFALAIVLLGAACANVSSLQIGATLKRRQEIGVRVALGAGRGRVGRQLITEHLLLAAIAGGIGLWIASILVPYVTASPLPIFGLGRVAIDLRVVAFVAGATALAGLLSGCVPAFHWAGHTPVDHMRGANRATGDRRLTRVRGLLVAGQVGMAALLLVTTVFLVQSAIATAAIHPGFDGERVQSLEYRLPANKYPDRRQQALFHEAVVARAAAIPGVKVAAVVRGLPMSGNGDTAGIRVEGMSATEDPRPAWFNTVSDHYFRALGIPLIEGRTFDERDGSEAPLVAVVSRTFANRAWPGQSAVGRDFEVAGFPIRPRVIGVVGDVRQYRLVDDVLPAFYARLQQNPGIFNTLIVQTAGDPALVRTALRGAIWHVDPDQPLWKERSLQSLVDAGLASSRYLSGALAILAGGAVLLVIGGLYGVVSQSVTARTREIGIRMVFGADRWTVLREVLSGGVRMTLGGLIPGLAAAALVSRWMQGYLYNSSPLDAVPYVTAAAGLILIALAACYVPARSATTVDPASAIRD